MKDNKVITTLLSVFLVFSIILNIYLGITLRNTKVDVNTQVVYVTDTIVKDSIQIQEKIKPIYTTFYDTAVIFQHDTVSDTIYVELPIEHKQYKDEIKKDSIHYNIEIDYSGFHPSLDKIAINTTYIKSETQIIQTKPWKFGIMIGPYIGYGGYINPSTHVMSAGPEIGIGIQLGWGYTFNTKH